MQHTEQPKRISYLDALRGFTMILVVVSHVAKFLDVETLSPGSFHYYFNNFRMPLFFFISGFVFYKAGFVWNRVNIKRFLCKKVTVQVISPLIFLACYVHYMHFSLWESLVDNFKAGYWFTFTLFEYFLLYIATRKISDLFGAEENKAIIAMFLMGLFLYLFPKQWLCSESLPPFVSDTFGLLGATRMMYFMFFVSGAWVRKNFASAEKILDKSHLTTFAVIIFFVTSIFFDTHSFNPYLQKITGLLLSMCGITIIFSLFRKHGSFFSTDNPASSLLKFIGRRTLDIYLLHSFFINFRLPEQMLSIIHNNPLLEFTVSLILTAITITACLAVSAALRTSDALAHFLFGAPKKQKQ